MPFAWIECKCPATRHPSKPQALLSCEELMHLSSKCSSWLYTHSLWLIWRSHDSQAPAQCISDAHFSFCSVCFAMLTGHVCPKMCHTWLTLCMQCWFRQCILWWGNQPQVPISVWALHSWLWQKLQPSQRDGDQKDRSSSVEIVFAFVDFLDSLSDFQVWLLASGLITAVRRTTVCSFLWVFWCPFWSNSGALPCSDDCSLWKAGFCLPFVIPIATECSVLMLFWEMNAGYWVIIFALMAWILRSWNLIAPCLMQRCSNSFTGSADCMVDRTFLPKFVYFWT